MYKMFNGMISYFSIPPIALNSTSISGIDAQSSRHTHCDHSTTWNVKLQTYSNTR